MARATSLQSATCTVKWDYKLDIRLQPDPHDRGTRAFTVTTAGTGRNTFEAAKRAKQKALRQAKAERDIFWSGRQPGTAWKKVSLRKFCT